MRADYNSYFVTIYIITRLYDEKKKEKVKRKGKRKEIKKEMKDRK